MVTTGLNAMVTNSEYDIVWYLISAENPSSTGVVKYGERLHIKSSKSIYLDTNGKSKQCPANNDVVGSLNKNRDAGSVRGSSRVTRESREMMCNGMELSTSKTCMAPNGTIWIHALILWEDGRLIMSPHLSKGIETGNLEAG
jgi:hypothetical protein